MNIYEDGSYLAKNPSWHSEDAPFKAKHIAELVRKNSVSFRSIAEIGCGAGAVLKSLHGLLGPHDATWKGYDISPDAVRMAQQDPQEGIVFFQQDLLETNESFDVLLIVDVFEHIPDYLNFITKCRTKAKYKIYHIPLDLHVSAIIRDSLTNARDLVGHLHYFSQKTAIATLIDTGHQIIDLKLTPGAIELFRQHPSFKRAIANVPRSIVSLFSPSLSTRLFGGHSLLVLAK